MLIFCTSDPDEHARENMVENLFYIIRASAKFWIKTLEGNLI